MKSRNRVLSAAAALAVSATMVAGQDFRSETHRPATVGALFTATNGASGNEVLAFDRLADGHLSPAERVSTGGLGTGAGLGNQGALVLSRDERWLLVVNAGNDTVSVLDASRRLRLVDVSSSGGVRPVSVTESRGVVYVLNAGSDSIAGFKLTRTGRLTPIPGATRGLSTTGTAPAQVAFTPGGDTLVVTEKATNRIVTFDVDRDGVAGEAVAQDSNGTTPFGFGFGKRGELLVSEAFGGAAGASATSSYDLDRHGLLTTISPSVATNQTAACWLAVTPNGRFAYVTNFGSGSISGYRIAFDGRVELLDADGRTGVTGEGSSPIDLAIPGSGRYLYSLNSGARSIGIFRVAIDGSLAPLPFFAGLPAGLNGLASR